MSASKRRTFFGGKKKRDNEKAKGRGVFLETYAVAPSPSRDYYALQIFQKKFQWTQWRICHGPFAAPTQRVVSLKDFKRDITLQHELTYIFGEDTTNLMSDIANEKWSLVSMPSSVLQKIFSYMSVPDILRLSKVSKRLSKECSSNELWKTICRKQWKILIHNDIEKASLIGWKTVYLEKMRPKRYRTEFGGHVPKPNFLYRNRVLSMSTLNTPDSRASFAKSNLTIPKRVQELKRCEPVRSNSEILGKDFKVTSMSAGKFTERPYAGVKGRTLSRAACDQRPISTEKLSVTPRTYLQKSSCSTINLVGPLDRGLAKIDVGTRPKPTQTPATKCKVTSIRARSASTQLLQPAAAAAAAAKAGKIRTERSRPNTGARSGKNL